MDLAGREVALLMGVLDFDDDVVGWVFDADEFELLM